MRFLGAASLALAVLMIGLSSIQTELSRQSLYSLSAAFWSEFRRFLADTHAPPGEILRRLSGFARYRELDFVSGTLQLLPEHRFQLTVQPSGEPGVPGGEGRRKGQEEFPVPECDLPGRFQPQPVWDAEQPEPVAVLVL